MKERPNIASRVLHWLRQGYPSGVPNHDTFALFYVLQRELTDEDLDELTELIIKEGADTTLRPEAITREDIATLISRMHRQPPEDEDITRIQEKLRAGGFPPCSNHSPRG